MASKINKNLILQVKGKKNYDLLLFSADSLLIYIAGACL
jgi:hypothetical protein